jgi:hypothetical protein
MPTLKALIDAVSQVKNATWKRSRYHRSGLDTLSGRTSDAGHSRAPIHHRRGDEADAFASDKREASRRTEGSLFRLLATNIPRHDGPRSPTGVGDSRARDSDRLHRAQTDESVRARSLEQGDAECLFKPFSDTALFDTLNAVFQVR